MWIVHIGNDFEGFLLCSSVNLASVMIASCIFCGFSLISHNSSSAFVIHLVEYSRAGINGIDFESKSIRVRVIVRR